MFIPFKNIYGNMCQDLATHTRVPPAARRQSLCQLASALNNNEAARAELDKWGLMIDCDIMQVWFITDDNAFS